MKKILQKTLLILLLPSTILIANNQLDFSSLVDEFMNEDNLLKKSINLSGKQRMLTQYMSKLTLQIHHNIQKKESQAKLKELAELYAKTLKAFKEGDSDLGLAKSTNKAILEQVKVIEKEWEVFYGHVKVMIEKDDTKVSLAYIMSNNEKLLKISNELVHRFETSNTSENYLEKARLRIVNVAGRQRMLTQKMTKEKLLSYKGNKEVNQQLLQTVKLFDDSLNALILGDQDKHITKATNEKITKQLKVVSTLWTKLKPLYEKEKLSSKEMAMILSKNTILLKEMNTMVGLSETEVEY